MKHEKLIPDASAALLLTFLGWLILSAGGIKWGSEGAGILVGFASMFFLIFVVARRIP